MSELDISLLPDIYPIMEYALDMRYGKQLNRHIERLPDDCWVLVLDHDTMFLTPHWFRTVSNAIVTYGDETDLFSCQVNRIGNAKRCYNGEFSNDMNIENHVKIATMLERTQAHKCEEIQDRIAAGVFLLFKKSLWQNNKFDDFPIIHKIDDRLTSFDVRFCEGIKGSMKKILGLYMWHSYRLGKRAADTTHLEVL